MPCDTVFTSVSLIVMLVLRSRFADRQAAATRRRPRVAGAVLRLAAISTVTVPEGPGRGCRGVVRVAPLQLDALPFPTTRSSSEPVTSTEKVTVMEKGPVTGAPTVAADGHRRFRIMASDHPWGQRTFRPQPRGGDGVGGQATAPGADSRAAGRGVSPREVVEAALAHTVRNPRRGRLRAVRPVRAPAPPDGRLGGLPRLAKWWGVQRAVAQIGVAYRYWFAGSIHSLHRQRARRASSVSHSFVTLDSV